VLVSRHALLLGMLLCLGACGVEGNWSLDREATRASLEQALEDRAPDQAGQVGAAVARRAVHALVEGLSVSLELRSDGAFTATIAGKNLSGQWTREGDRVMLTPSGGEDPIVLRRRGGRLSLEHDRAPGATIYLQRD